MHSAALNHVNLIKNPNFSLTREIAMDEDGGRRLQQLKFLAFGSSGKLCLIHFADT